MIDSDVDCLIQTLNQLLNFNYPSQISKSRWIIKERGRVKLLYDELLLLRIFLDHSEEARCTNERVRALVIMILDVASEVEDMIDSFVFSFVQNKNTEYLDHERCLKLDNVMQTIQVIKKGVLEFGNHKLDQNVMKEKGSTSRVNTVVPKEDKIVGFDFEAREILDRLVGDKKQLDVISIVGMGGLGKTTLAKRAFFDRFVLYHFYIRGWVSVSQTYHKRDLLFSICTSLSLKNLSGEMSTEKLREVLYKGLKGQRYLVVIDDIWSVDAWNDIRICFPDDNIGSRILVTSRLMNVALHIKPDSPPHLLRFLTVEESWDLLQHKVFSEDATCPVSLQKIGEFIAERCGGLPLAVLVISGLLEKTEKTVHWWTRVLDSIGSYIVSDREQYMNTLALSYNHLPRHLKSCFLYFGAFPEDFEINVRKLMRLWVAEGFIKSGSEDVAEEYLIELVERSLLIVDQKRADGGIKSCRVHDLLLDLCLKKGKEENFMHEIKPSEEMASSPYKSLRRSFIHSHIRDYVVSKPFSLSTRSFLFFKLGTDYYGISKHNVSFIYSAFKYVRVLELRSVLTPFLPSEIGQLVQLRYLSLRTQGLSLPKSISTLWNLQTLLVYGESAAIDIPFCKDSNLANLTHMCIWPCVRSQYHLALPNIQTISMLHLSVGRQLLLENAPNLRKLGCVVSEQQDSSVLFPPLDFLVHLEKLKIKINIDYRRRFQSPVRFTSLNRLPHNLRKVTFLNCYLPWTDLSELGKLPNLEILKILRGNFQGYRWDTNDGEFRKLKYLEFQSAELLVWNTYSDHFPGLERLAMIGCRHIQEIPTCIGDIPTMKLIELTWPSETQIHSARQIIEEQESLGNDGLKLIIYDRIKDGPQFPVKW